LDGSIEASAQAIFGVTDVTGPRLAGSLRAPDGGRVSVMKIDGGCHCGYITYEAEADPEKTTICHCTDCQRLSGSTFRTVVRVPGDTFKIIAGEPTIYLRPPKAAQNECKDSAPDAERQFTRPAKATSRNSTPSVWGLYANALRLSRRYRFGRAHNCIGSMTLSPFEGWISSKHAPLIRAHGISSDARRCFSRGVRMNLDNAAQEGSMCLEINPRHSRAINE
jgi:hypothetical protein